MAKGGRKQPKSAGKRLTRSPMLIAVMLVGLIFAGLPTATLLFVGMAPTLVALIVDVTPGRYLARCVAGMNFAGLVPFLHQLWSRGHTMSLALDIVTDVFAWFIIYGASAIGWLLFFGLPGAVSMARVLNGKRRIYMLREKQKLLINEWGDSILAPAEAKEAAKPEERKSRSQAAAALDEAIRAERTQ
jgi:hypothetical protein